MKVLVTGGSGFIGTNLVQELQSRGHNVVICDLLNNSLENYYRCDVSKIRQIENIFEKSGTRKTQKLEVKIRLMYLILP